MLPPIQPHTLAKHHILEYHLNQWFPILGRTHRRLRYIDGFAGPGEYEGGDTGSPILALETIRQHSEFERFEREGKTIEFLFVERDEDFYQSLHRRVGNSSWPGNFKISVEHGEFEAVLTRILNYDDAEDGLPPPTLLFVDPFGSAGFPMSLFRRMSVFSRVDALINLNHAEFVRWILPDPLKHVTADRLYGDSRWGPALSMTGRVLGQFLVDEYEKALHDIGWITTSFEMVNMLNQPAYHLVFGTGSPKGLEAMKRAMRNASQTGEFRYSDRIDSAQPILLGLNMTEQFPAEIAELLFRKYEGQEIPFDRLVEEEIDEHRWWLESDLRSALLILEYGDDPQISEVRYVDGRIRRARSYPPGTHITFGRPNAPEQGQLPLK